MEKDRFKKILNGFHDICTVSMFYLRFHKERVYKLTYCQIYLGENTLISTKEFKGIEAVGSAY